MHADMRETGGFTKTIAASLVLHVMFITAAVFLHKPSGKRYISPAYTMVNLVEHRRGETTAAAQTPGNADVSHEKELPKPAPPTTPDAGKTRARPVVKAAKTVKLPPVVKVSKAEKGANIDLALKKIKENVKKKEADDLVATKVAAIKKRHDNRGSDDAAGTSSAIDAIKKRLSAQSSGQSSASVTGGQAAAQGNGTALSRDALETRYQAYYALIRDRVQENWKYPYSDDKVIIIVSIKIARSGELLKAGIEESSGNPLFDESLLGAIKKAAPFAPLPQGFPDDYLDAELRFCPGCAQ